MQYKSVKGFTGWGALGILLVFVGGGFILAGVFQLVIAMQMFPESAGLETIMKTLPEAMKKPENTLLVQVSQVIGTFMLFFVPAAMFSLIVNGKNKFWLGFNKYVNIQQIFIGFCIIFLANLIAGPLADLSKYVVGFFPDLNAKAINLEKLYNEQLMAMSNLNGWGQYLLALFIIAFFPAVFEEVFFRGALQNLLVRWLRSPFNAILITSLIFSLIHGSIYLFLSRLVLGIVLGLLYHKGKNIWVNIVAHFLNNAIAVTSLFFMVRAGKPINPDAVDPQVPYWGAIVGVAALVVLFIIYDRKSRSNLERINAKEAILTAAADPFTGIAGDINR